MKLDKRCTAPPFAHTHIHTHGSDNDGKNVQGSNSTPASYSPATSYNTYILVVTAAVVCLPEYVSLVGCRSLPPPPSYPHPCAYEPQPWSCLRLVHDYRGVRQAVAGLQPGLGKRTGAGDLALGCLDPALDPGWAASACLCFIGAGVPEPQLWEAGGSCPQPAPATPLHPHPRRPDRSACCHAGQVRAGRWCWDHGVAWLAPPYYSAALHNAAVIQDPGSWLLVHHGPRIHDVVLHSWLRRYTLTKAELRPQCTQQQGFLGSWSILEPWDPGASWNPGILVHRGTLGSWCILEPWDPGASWNPGILVHPGTLGSWCILEPWDPGAS